MITAKPLDFVDINHFSYPERLDIMQGNAITCYLQLFDGSNRYVPPAGSSSQVVFPRSPTIAATPANQDVTVTLNLADPRDYSIYVFNLTATQTNTIVSGGVKILITSNGVTKTYIVDDFVRRRSNIPGA